jgi:glutathione S-transferase
MPPLTLVMGPKNYSSWSMRPWLALKHAELDFDEITIDFTSPTAKAEILKYSPSGTVPALLHGDRTIWVSLAICEYVAELAPEKRLWPEDAAARAHARSVCAEMVGGFACLRSQMPMNARARYPGKGMGPGVAEDIDRIREIWKVCRERFGAGGDFLFGPFTIQ